MDGTQSIDAGLHPSTKTEGAFWPRALRRMLAPVRLWIEREHERQWLLRTIEMNGDRELHSQGISRGDLLKVASKPFWRA